MLEETIIDLSQRLADMEELKANNYYEKSKFMEGATWLAEKVIKEIDRFSPRLTDLIQEFKERVGQSDQD